MRSAQRRRHELQLLVVTVLAVAGGYAVNVLLVCVHASVEYGVSPFAVLAQLRIGGLTEFLVSYVGLGLLGAILALLDSQRRLLGPCDISCAACFSLDRCSSRAWRSKRPAISSEIACASLVRSRTAWRRSGRTNARRSPATSTTTLRSLSSSSPSGSRWRRSGSPTVTWWRWPRTWTTSAPSRSAPPSWCARSCETCIATRSVERVSARPSSPSGTKSRATRPSRSPSTSSRSRCRRRSSCSSTRSAARPS